MSVIKSKREESTVLFLDNAIDLHVYTLKQCMKFPKRYTIFITKGIVDLSRECLNCVKAANSIYPQNKHELQLRRDYFIKANICVQNMYTQLDIAKNCFPIEDKKLIEWIRLLREEERTVKGIMKSDLKTFKF